MVLREALPEIVHNREIVLRVCITGLGALQKRAIRRRIIPLLYAAPTGGFAGPDWMR